MDKQARDILSFSSALLEVKRPWYVEEVLKDDRANTLEARVMLERGTQVCCPKCDYKTDRRYDHQTRRLRDMDWRKYQMFLCIAVPRIKCPTHGVLQIAHPFQSRPRVQTTKCFEEYVLTLLKSMSIKETAALVKISANQVNRILDDAVTRGLDRRAMAMPEKISVDETSCRKRHKYVTVVNDLNGKVLYVAPGRDAETLAAYFKQFDDDQLGKLTHVVTDMGPAYISAVYEHTDAVVVIDKYHVIAALNRAVDTIRRAECKWYAKRGGKLLKHSRHLLHKTFDKMSDSQQERLMRMKRATCKVTRAWDRVEMARQIWDQPDWKTADFYWRKWLKSARLSRLKPLQKVADTIEKHLLGIINAGVTKLSNGKAESINSKIQYVKKMARGYKNDQNFCNAIYFHCGGWICHLDSDSILKGDAPKISFPNGND